MKKRDHVVLAGKLLILSVIGTVMSSATTTGCSRKLDKWEMQRPPTYEVNGVVLWDGKPEPQCLVAFESKSHSLIAVGMTDADGRFTLKTFKPGDGAVAGENAVRLEKTVKVEDGDVSQSRPPAWFVVTPKKYASAASSGLTATVKSEGENAVTLEITGARLKP